MASAVHIKKGVGVTTMKRIPTGVAELDLKLSGGYPKGKAVLITGASGAGKTIFGLQFIHRSCTDGLKCVHIATEESPEDLLVQAGMLGLDLEHYLDCGQLVIKRVLETRMRNIGQAVDFGSRSPATDIDIIKQVRLVPDDTDVVVIDNIGVFALDMSIKEFRDRIDMINYTLTTSKGCTVLFIMDKTAYELTHEVSKYSSYGSIKLIMKENPYTEKIERYITIPKMRSTKLSLELSVFDITSEGIKIRESGTKKG